MARTISAKYQTQLANSLRWARSYIYLPNGAITIHDNQYLIEYKIITNLQKDGSIFGNTIAKYAEIKLKNPNNNTLNIAINQTVEIFSGLTLDVGLATESVEYLKQGVFQVYAIKADEDNETITLEAYDGMVKLNAPYYEIGGTYPMTLSALVNSLCVRANLELGDPNFTNSTLSVPAPNVAANEYTIRDVLSWVCELTATNALIGDDGKLYLKSYGSTPAFTITPDLYTKLKSMTHFGPINTVEMTREALGDTVAYPDPLPANTITYKIIDNMVAYDQRESIIGSIHNLVNGFQYTPFELAWRGTGHLNFMDKVNIVNTDNETITTYIMNQTVVFNGGLSEELNAVAYSAAAAAVKNAGTSNNKLRHTEAKVNKVDGEISLVVSEVDDLGSDVTQLYLDLGNISATVTDHTGAIGALTVQADSIVSSVSALNGRTTTIEQDLDSVEISIVDYEDGKLSGAKYNFDGTGATFTNGGLTIKNNSGVNVLSADVNGNLTLKGTLDAVGGTFTGALSAATGSFSGAVTTGSLTATGGTVGGWNITSNSIYKGNTKLDATNDRLYLNTNASLYGYSTGTIGVSGSLFLGTAGNTVKIVDSNGSLEFGNGSITALNASSGLKTVNLNGHPILTTNSAASASTRGGLKVEYDSATATLNIYN